MSEAINVVNLTKKYNNSVLAIDNINFKIHDGEIFGFLGPNGAGKTTTIHILTTLILPTSGKAFVSGYDVVKEPHKVRNIIGLVPQELTADDELTGMENILLQASLYGLDKKYAIKKADMLLNMVELSEAANRLVKTYSGGMRRRLELIMGLIHEPNILFLDEPTLGLDVQTRVKIWDYIKMLRKEFNMTIFLTTHYMEEADHLCDRIGIIDQGKIIALGSPNELKKQIKGDIIIVKINNIIKLENSINQIFKNVPGYKRVNLLNNKISIYVDKGEEALPTVIEKLIHKGIKITSIEVIKPSLEQVFLYLTGKSIREESAIDSIKMRAIMRRRR